MPKSGNKYLECFQMELIFQQLYFPKKELPKAKIL